VVQYAPIHLDITWRINAEISESGLFSADDGDGLLFYAFNLRWIGHTNNQFFFTEHIVYHWTLVRSSNSHDRYDCYYYRCVSYPQEEENGE
jgi:hypothetical protein